MSSTNYQERFARVSSGLADVLTCLHHISLSQAEIITKVKLIRGIGVKSRVKELSKINEAISVVEAKLQTILNNTKCKSYVMYSHNSNLAEFRHEQQNKNFELVSRNTHVTCHESAYGQMIACVKKSQCTGRGYRSENNIPCYAKKSHTRICNSNNKHNIPYVANL